MKFITFLKKGMQISLTTHGSEEMRTKKMNVQAASGLHQEGGPTCPSTWLGSYLPESHRTSREDKRGSKQTLKPSSKGPPNISNLHKGLIHLVKGLPVFAIVKRGDSNDFFLLVHNRHRKNIFNHPSGLI